MLSFAVASLDWDGGTGKEEVSLPYWFIPWCYFYGIRDRIAGFYVEKKILYVDLVVSAYQGILKAFVLP